MQKLASAERSLQTASSDFLEAVLEGLSLPQKALPSRFFYDEAGSALFERITGLPEYYPTRTEIALLNSYSGEIGESVPSGATVVEFGSGSSRKTGLLLSALGRPRAYIPIDISPSALYPAARRIQRMFPGIDVHPVLGSFGDLGVMQLPAGAHPCIGFFPGSTIGNLAPAEAVSFLRSARRYLGPDAHFIVGADLQKPLDILLPAYDDAQGVTAAFNRNILAQINRELGGTFNPGWFEHAAAYNETEGRNRNALARIEGASRACSRPLLRLPRRGDDPHRELLQIHGGWLPSACESRRLAAAQGLDRRGKPFLPAPARLRSGEIAWRGGQLPFLGFPGGRIAQVAQCRCATTLVAPPHRQGFHFFHRAPRFKPYRHRRRKPRTALVSRCTEQKPHLRLA